MAETKDLIDRAKLRLERTMVALKLIMSGLDRPGHNETLSFWALEECNDAQKELSLAHAQAPIASAGVSLRIPDPDAKLIELVAAHAAADTERNRVLCEAEREEGPGAFEEHPRYKERYRVLERHEQVLFNQIKATPATTLKGLAARVRSAFFDQELDKVNPDHVCGELLAACMADLDRLSRR